MSCRSILVRQPAHCSSPWPAWSRAMSTCRTVWELPAASVAVHCDCHVKYLWGSYPGLLVRLLLQAERTVSLEDQLWRRKKGTLLWPTTWRFHCCVVLDAALYCPRLRLTFKSASTSESYIAAAKQQKFARKKRTTGATKERWERTEWMLKSGPHEVDSVLESERLDKSFCGDRW